MSTIQISRTAGQSNITKMERNHKELEVMVGAPGNGERGARTLRLINRDGSFMRIERHAVLQADMEIGGCYKITALVTERENIRNAKSFMVNEVFTAEPIEKFVPEAFIVEYVTEPATTKAHFGLA